MYLLTYLKTLKTQNNYLNMNKFIFDLVTQDGFYDFPEFDSQEEFEEYIGEKVPVEFNDEETTIWKFEEEWKDSHNFAVVSNKVDEYDLEKSSVIRRAIYTINNKYYELYYVENPYSDPELWQEPTEVVPIEKTVTITEYVEKR